MSAKAAQESLSSSLTIAKALRACVRILGVSLTCKKPTDDTAPAIARACSADEEADELRSISGMGEPSAVMMMVLNCDEW